MKKKWRNFFKSLIACISGMVQRIFLEFGMLLPLSWGHLYSKFEAIRIRHYRATCAWKLLTLFMPFKPIAFTIRRLQVQSVYIPQCMVRNGEDLTEDDFSRKFKLNRNRLKVDPRGFPLCHGNCIYGSRVVMYTIGLHNHQVYYPYKAKVCHNV